MPLYDKQTPLSVADLARFQQALENLQGNLLKPHGRPAAAHVFITFQTSAADASRFLGEMSKCATSANEQTRQTLDRRNTGAEHLFQECMLSAAGYRFLGLPVADFDIFFSKGMKGAAQRLSDPDPKDWESAFQNELHAMLLIAHVDPKQIQRRVKEIFAALTGIATAFVEIGKANFRSSDTEHKQQIEHFGFSDGLSQPLFFADDVDQPSQFWDSGAGPNLILRKDPLGNSDEACGSYFVFRKLEQDVCGFRRRVRQLACEMNPDAPDEKLAGAIVMGRFQDGTPVSLSDRPLGGPTPPNDFLFSIEDPTGNRCPVTSHIRKANPRGDTGDLAIERNRRIARRGISYGDPTLLGGKVGLLFQCCNRDLANQFEFLQARWCGNTGFPGATSGIDPIISNADTQSNQKWPKGWNTTERVSFSFQNFVTMRGGEYFFVPSISFLKGLA